MFKLCSDFKFATLNDKKDCMSALPENILPFHM